MKNDYLKIFAVFFITVIIVFLALEYIFLGKNAGPTTKASASLFAVNYVGDPPNPAQNTDFNETINIKPTVDVSLRGYSVRLNFDKTKLQLKNITYLLGVASPDFGNTNANLAAINANGSTYLQGEIQNSNPFIVSNGTNVTLITLTFTNIGATGTTVVDGGNTNFYTVDSTGALTMNSANVPDLLVNGGGAITGTGGPTCTSFSDDFSGTAIDTKKWGVWSTNNTGTVNIENGAAKILLPASPTATSTATTLFSTQNNITGDFVAEETLKTLNPETGKNWGSLEFSFTGTDTKSAFRLARYSDRPGKITSVIINNGVWADSVDANIGISPNAPVRIKLERIGNKGNIYYDILDGQGYKLFRSIDNIYSGPGYFETLSVNGQPNYPDVTSTFDDFKLTCAATPSPTPTGTSGAAGNVKLNLKLKFQGITGTPGSNNSMTVTGKLLNSATGSQAVTGTGTFTANSSGIWSGTIGFNIPNTAGTFTLLINGDKSMAKKICVNNPTESTPGTYHCTNPNMTISAGDNNFDFSQITLLQGDLNQDGVVDSVDFGTVKNLLGKTDSASLAKADINHDGRVDTQDVSLIITALSFKLGDSL